MNISPDPTRAQRTGLALILAALRRDHETVVHLVTATDAQEMLDVAVFCAQFAAEKCREQQEADPSLDFDLALRTVALQLAARSPGTGG